MGLKHIESWWNPTQSLTCIHTSDSRLWQYTWDILWGSLHSAHSWKSFYWSNKTVYTRNRQSDRRFLSGSSACKWESWSTYFLSPRCFLWSILTNRFYKCLNYQNSRYSGSLCRYVCMISMYYGRQCRRIGSRGIMSRSRQWLTLRRSRLLTSGNRLRSFRESGHPCTIHTF